MARANRRFVRQMPKIYGSMQKPRRDWSAFFRMARQACYVLGILFLIYIIFFGPLFRVRKVDIQGVVLSNPKDLSQAVPLGGSIWFLPKTSIFHNLASDPLISSVSILRGLPDTVQLRITERQPVLVWQTGGKTILIDNQGIAFTQYENNTLPDAASTAGTKIATLPKIVDTKNVTVTLGDPVVGVNFITFLTTMQADMKLYLPSIQMDHAEVADTTYDLTVITKPGMQVVFNTLGDAGVQVRNLTRLVHQNKVNLASSHVDLRIDRWAYVS